MCDLWDRGYPEPMKAVALDEFTEEGFFSRMANTHGVWLWTKLAAQSLGFLAVYFVLILIVVGGDLSTLLILY